MMRLSAYLILGLCVLANLLFATHSRFTPIEDFESGNVTLTSYSTEDVEPTGWTHDQTQVYTGSTYSLKLTGHTWKQEAITPVVVDSNNVFQVAI